MKLRFLDLSIFFLFFWNKEGDVKAFVLLSYYSRRGPRDDTANLVIFKLHLGSLKLYILFFVE